MCIRVFFLGLFCLVLGQVTAQMRDCTLGIGGKDTEVIVQVFQLDSAQQATLQSLVGELRQYHEGLGMKVRELFDTHPQQSMEELQQLAAKYNALKVEAEETAKIYDRRLLSLFNERQYARYASLCSEAKREPMTPVQLVVEEGSEP